MTFEQLLKAAREDLGETAGGTDASYNLTSSIALRLYNEAIHEACRRARLIVDRSTAAICTYTVTAGSPVITLDPRIIKIRRATLVGRTAPLTRRYLVDMEDRGTAWEDETGDTDSYVADYESGKICLYRKPAANGTLKLVVVRLPLLDLETEENSPEIQAQYHHALRHYVVAEMRSVDDTELYDPRKAAIAAAKFEAEFGPKRSARDEVWDNSQPFEEYE